MIALQGSPQEAATKGRFRPETTNPEEFDRSLNGVLPRVQEALFTGRPTLEQLDRLTEGITSAIATALAASVTAGLMVDASVVDIGFLARERVFGRHR